MNGHYDGPLKIYYIAYWAGSDRSMVTRGEVSGDDIMFQDPIEVVEGIERKRNPGLSGMAITNISLGSCNHTPTKL